jgi:hypothetical protein
MTDTPADDTLLRAGRDERRWRRRSLWALVVAVPLAVVLSGWEGISDLAHGREWFGSAVDVGAEGRYADADWRVEEIQAMPDQAAGMRLPPGAVPIRVRFSVTVRGPGVDVSWLPCQVALVDGQGRRWAAMGFGGLPSSGADVMLCGSITRDPHQPGDVLKVEESFVVPKDVAGSVEPTVSVEAARPRFLRFHRAS